MTKCMEVIYSDETRRGSGENRWSPIRRIIKIFDKDGNEIAENDDMSFSIESLLTTVDETAKIFTSDYGEIDKARTHILKLIGQGEINGK
jgi:hypothetical protein